MRIDQRNAGASVTPSGSVPYTLDRWTFDLSQTSKLTCQQNSGSVTPPTGFTKYLGVVSSSAYSITSSDYFAVKQVIEGFNIADLAWGTASAATVTLSFWVRSSLTGTFGGVISNGSNARAYPFTYTINSANTWEKETITIVGDTTGTWASDNTAGIELNFGLGVGSTFSGTAGTWAAGNFLSATGATSVVGTNGATFYITGVQLEKGTTATSFDYRDYGRELAMCQRYYYVHASGSPFNIGSGFYYSSSFVTALIYFPVSMRTAPVLVQSTGTNYYGIYANSALDTFDSFNSGIAQPSTQSCGIEVSTGVSGTAGQAGRVVTNNASASIAFNSEL
jgi:hypothetical protein